MPYASVQAIRESAGLLSKSENKKPNGAVDGTNRVFVVVRRPIVDSNNDDAVTKDDVKAFVDGIPVTVESVVADTGVVTLVTAPISGKVVTLDHYFSPLTDAYTAGKAAEADSWVHARLKASSLRPMPDLPLRPAPEMVCTAAELYAAGIILTKDSGSRFDSEQTSRDGQLKFKQARAIMDDYIAGAEADQRLSQSDSNNTAVAASDGDVFDRAPDQYGNTTEDDFFWRRQ